MKMGPSTEGVKYNANHRMLGIQKQIGVLEFTGERSDD